MEKAKISFKHQVVIPKLTREELGVKAGDEILFIRRNGLVYLLPRGKSLAKVLKGTARGKLRYPKNYLKGERSSW